MALHAPPETGEIRFKWKRLGNSPVGTTRLREGTLTLVGNTIYHLSRRGYLSLISHNTWKRINLVMHASLRGLHGGQVAQLAGDKIFYFGGTNPNMIEYDTVLAVARRLQLEPGNPGPCRREWMSAVFTPWRQEIVTFGGYINGRQRRSHETHTFNVHTKTWKKLELRGERPAERTGHGAAVCGTKMYIYGGYNWRGQVLNDICIAELSNAVVPFWSYPRVNGRVPASRPHPSLSCFNGVLVVYGDVHPSSPDLEVFLPWESTWHGKYSANVVVENDPKLLVKEHLAVTLTDGIAYLTEHGVYCLQQQ